MKLHFTRDEVEARRSRATSYHPVVWPCQNEDDWLTLMDEVERLEADVKALCDMLTDTYLRENHGEVIDSGVPDWIVMAHSLAEAAKGKGTDVQSIIDKLEKGADG